MVSETNTETHHKYFLPYLLLIAVKNWLKIILCAGSVGSVPFHSFLYTISKNKKEKRLIYILLFKRRCFVSFFCPNLPITPFFLQYLPTNSFLKNYIYALQMQSVCGKDYYCLRNLIFLNS